MIFGMCHMLFGMPEISYESRAMRPRIQNGTLSDGELVFCDLEFDCQKLVAGS